MMPKPPQHVRQACPGMDAAGLGILCADIWHLWLPTSIVPSPLATSPTLPYPPSEGRVGPLDRAPGRVVPVFPFFILGWSVWYQDLDCSPFFPHPVPSQPDLLPWAWGGHPYPGPAGGTCWLLTRRHCLPVWGSTLEVSWPRWGRGVLLHLL